MDKACFLATVAKNRIYLATSHLSIFTPL